MFLLLTALFAISAVLQNSLYYTRFAFACQVLFSFFSDPYRIRTDVKGVRGLCLNHLTNGPEIHLQGLGNRGAICHRHIAGIAIRVLGSPVRLIHLQGLEPWTP